MRTPAHRAQWWVALLVVSGCAAVQRPTAAPSALGIVREATEVSTDAPRIERIEVTYDATASAPDRIELTGPLDEVPEAVRAAAAARLGGPAPATASQVIDGDGLAFYRFEAPDAAGRACRIAIDAQAELVELECALGADETLPAAVLSTADRLTGGPVTYAARRRTSAEESFVVQVRPGARVEILEIASDGTLLDHRVRFEGAIELPYLGAPSGAH